VIYFCTPRTAENNKGKEYQSLMFVFHTGRHGEGNILLASFPGELGLYDCWARTSY